MNSDHDSVHETLNPLRARIWNRPEHQQRLERELLEARKQTAMNTSIWKKAATIAVIVVAGGLAGAGTLALVEHYFVEETVLPGDMRHVRITDTTTNTVVMDEDIHNDEAIFTIDGDEDNADTLLRVRPVPAPDDTAPKEH
jgi:hypothetical protein